MDADHHGFRAVPLIVGIVEIGIAISLVLIFGSNLFTLPMGAILMWLGVTSIRIALTGSQRLVDEMTLSRKAASAESLAEYARHTGVSLQDRNTEPAQSDADPTRSVSSGTDGKGNAMTAQKKPGAPVLPEGYPKGWWVPERHPAVMAVEGSPEMTSLEYARAFTNKLAAAMEKQGRESARETILDFLEPFRREEYFDEDADFETWAQNVEGMLCFPLASPDSMKPASAKSAQQAVDAQDELSLSEILSAGKM